MVLDGDPTGRLRSTFGPGIVPEDDATRGDFFGFSEFVRALTAMPGITLVKAHRDRDPGVGLGWAGDRTQFRPDLELFRFDAVDLAQFDQLWLFGIGALAHTPKLTDAENAAVARFMDGGGGALATGDHADIGAPMCGRIPRVRSMRAWFVANPPDAEPTAPDPLSANRNDTTRWGPGEEASSADFRFTDQSDDRPAPITPTTAGARHPLLDLGNGRRLTHLPDHMHEGAVIDPFDRSFAMSPTLSYPAAAAVFVEYPMTIDGRRPRPEVLALGTTLGGHSTISHEPWHNGTAVPTAPGDRLHGVIGAYDGHPARVGRVVVTSTFHQFADINLVGDPRATHPDGTPDELRRLGFRASPDGLAHLADQRAWWARIVSWVGRVDA